MYCQQAAIAPQQNPFLYGDFMPEEDDNLDNATTWNTPASGSLSPTFNGLNQISTWGSNSYSYDANGNTLSGDGTKTYKWDAENRLIEIDYTSGAKSVFSYDGTGHRVVDAETVSGTTTTTRYLWCGQRICQTRDGSDNVLRRYMSEGEENVSSGQKLVYMEDQLGSVRDVIDATTGNLAQSYDYTPYGAVARSSGSTPTDFQFGMLFYHPASGLLFSMTRALDGVTGRWLNRDPIREVGDINLYAYVGANTINYTDTEGLAEERIKGKTFTVHKNDADPWPSKPHAHIYEENQVVDKFGNIYNKATGEFVGRVPKKAMPKLLALFEKAGHCVKILAPVLFIYDWSTQGLGGAVNNQLWPISTIWDKEEQ